jgi:hypothetical protein
MKSFAYIFRKKSMCLHLSHSYERESVADSNEHKLPFLDVGGYGYWEMRPER